jgi:hypothetical protein
MKEKFKNNITLKNTEETTSFGIEKELEEIKKKYHGQEGLNKIKELKDMWRFQKIGLAEIQNKALAQVIENKENFRVASFLRENEDLFEKYLLTDDIIKKIKKALNICEKRVKKIELLKKECSDEEGNIDSKKIFTKIFQIEPEGKVEAIFRPLNIYFKMNSENDFALAYTGKGINKKKLTPTDLEACKSYAGAKLEKSVFPELKGAIVIESPASFSDYELFRNIIKHEEQHVVNDIIFRVHSSDKNYVLKMIKKVNFNNMEKIFDLVRNSKIEEKIKDEISAHFAENCFVKDISPSLLMPDTVYSYGYEYNISETDKTDMHADYFKVVQNGIIAFANLLKAGYKIEDIQGILVPEPLLTWPKVSERMIDRVRSSSDKKNDIKKYIHEDVIKLSQDAKELFKK